MKTNPEESKFPLCERLGLTVWHKGSVEAGNGQGFYAEVIEARKLESILASAPVVFGYVEKDGWTERPEDYKTNIFKLQGRVLMIEEIPKAVTKERIEKVMCKATAFHIGSVQSEMVKILADILIHGYRG